MIDDEMDKEQMALPPQPEFRSKPALPALIIMLGVWLTLFWPLLYISGWPLFTEIHIANADLKDGLLMKIAMLNAGFKTGDKIISVDGTNKKFDNQYKLFLGRILIERNGTGNHKMPIDFIDQLSKFEKEPYWTSEGRLSLVRFASLQ
jgi:regulator of sigma E protease